jgi:hypothetical protein
MGLAIFFLPEGSGMERNWLKYKHDAEIGPLLATYSLTRDELETLKRDLRDSHNIDGILEVSRRQVAIKYEIAKLIGVEEDRHFQKRMSLLWMVAVFALVLIAAANLALRLGVV